METTENARYEEARRHVHKLRGFYSHAAVYFVIMGFLLLVNLTTSPGHFWVQWAAFGWGIGLLSHGFSVFAVHGIFGADWEERKIREYLERQSR
jgi:hypothetical protein